MHSLHGTLLGVGEPLVKVAIQTVPHIRISFWCGLGIDGFHPAASVRAQRKAAPGRFLVALKEASAAELRGGILSKGRQRP